MYPEDNLSGLERGVLLGAYVGREDVLLTVKERYRKTDVLSLCVVPENLMEALSEVRDVMSKTFLPLHYSVFVEYSEFVLVQSTLFDTCRQQSHPFQLLLTSLGQAKV